MIASLLYAILGLIEALLGIRFVLRLLGANPANAFVDLIYDLSAPLVAPFAGILGQSATVTGEGFVARSVFDWTTLIAMIVFALIAAVIGSAIRSSRSRTIGV